MDARPIEPGQDTVEHFIRAQMTRWGGSWASDETQDRSALGTTNLHLPSTQRYNTLWSRVKPGAFSEADVCVCSLVDALANRNEISPSVKQASSTLCNGNSTPVVSACNALLVFGWGKRGLLQQLGQYGTIPPYEDPAIHPGNYPYSTGDSLVADLYGY